MKICHFGTQFSRRGVGLMVGLDDLRGLFQPMILMFCNHFLVYLQVLLDCTIVQHLLFVRRTFLTSVSSISIS